MTWQLVGPFRDRLQSRLADRRYLGFITGTRSTTGADPIAGLGLMIIDWPQFPALVCLANHLPGT